MNLTSPKICSVCLKPGKLFIGSEPREVVTVLGSCVSVTMFNPRLKLAAICHAMLADPDITRGEQEEPYKYVSLVVPAMVEKFRRLGIDPEETEVKLFGGANVFGFKNEKKHGRGIGIANIQRSKELLKQFDLRIARSHVGGYIGRKLIFNTATGIVWLKCLKSNTTTIKHHALKHYGIYSSEENQGSDH